MDRGFQKESGPVSWGDRDHRAPTEPVAFGPRFGDFVRLAPTPRPAHGRFRGFDGPGRRRPQQLAGVALPDLSRQRSLGSAPALSVLRRHPARGVTATWQRVAGVNYFLEGSTNLSAGPSFTSLAPSVPGQTSTTTFTDTNAAPLSRLFYRVGMP